MENHIDGCQDTLKDIKVQKRKQEIKDLMGDKIEELCENIIKIHEAHNKRDYVEGNHKLSFDASIKMEAAIHKEPMIHYYAKDILDEHNLPLFSSDEAYSVKDVQDKGYCCYSGPIPCPERAEAFFVDCHGNPKQRFLCQQKLGLQNKSILPDQDYFCETHSFYNAEHLRKERILTEEQKEVLRVNGRKDRMLELFIEFLVKNRCKMLRPNFNRSGWSHLEDHSHEIFIPNHWAT